jgi:phage terminase large subunit
MSDIVTGYSPRPYQSFLHANVKRFNVLVMHRRFGKTVFAVNEIIDQLLRCPWPNPQYAYIAPTYSAAKRIAWKEFKRFTARIPGVRVNEADLRIEIPLGAEKVGTIMLLGAENPDSLRGIYLDGCVLDEYASMSEVVWVEVIRPALSDRRGWCIFASTFKGNNHFYKLYMRTLKRIREGDKKSWFVANFKASQTKILPEEELREARNSMSEEAYLQEYENEVSASLPGAYYGSQISLAHKEGRVTVVPYEPGIPVSTGWDLGLDDSTAVWFFQMVGYQPRVIDYLEVSNKSLEELDREYFLQLPYTYDRHYLPHDAKVRDLVTKTSRVRAMESLSFARHAELVVVDKHRVEDRIDATRNFLKKCWFDRLKTEYGLECLSNYERLFDKVQGVFKQKPLHNWASHGADAFGTFVMGYNNKGGLMRKDLPEYAEVEYDPFAI